MTKITFKNFEPDLPTRASLSETFVALAELLQRRFAPCGPYDLSGFLERSGLVYQCRVEMRSSNEAYQMNALANDPKTAAIRLHKQIHEGRETLHEKSSDRN